MLAITILLNYLDRNNLSLAIPWMAQEFGWSDREIGAKGELVLAVFFISYALSNMMLSPLAERFGAKWSVIFAIAVFSIVRVIDFVWWGGCSLIPGTIVAATGSFDAGMLSIVFGAWVASAVMFMLSRMMRY